MTRPDMPWLGYFDDPSQTEPAYDPPKDSICPVCMKQLSQPMVALSLMEMRANICWFYRVHRTCKSDEAALAAVDSSIIDAED